MSKSLPSLRKLDRDLAEKLGGPFEVHSIITSDRVRILAFVEVIAILGLTGFGIYRLIGVFSTPELYFWIAALIAAAIFWFVGLFSRIRSSSAFLRAGEAALTIGLRGQLHRVIPYDQIDSIHFKSQSEADWLRICLRGGEVLSWPFYTFTSTSKGAESTLVRVMGPRLRSDAVFEWGPRPEKALAALAYDHFYQIPRVDLRTNVVYRYAQRDELKEEIGGAGWNLFENVFGFSCLPLFSVGVFWFLLVFSLLNSVHVWHWTPRFLLRRSLTDRLELVEEGLRVTRGDSTWIVPMVPTKGFLPSKVHYLHGTALRFGRGRTIYYFDARFVEVDT